MITDITQKSDFMKLLEGNVCVVDFWAPWCGPCRMLSSVLEELDQVMGDKIQVVKINVDEAQELAEDFNIQSLPTLLLFKNEALLDQKAGFLSKNSLAKWLETNGI